MTLTRLSTQPNRGSKNAWALTWERSRILLNGGGGGNIPVDTKDCPTDRVSHKAHTSSRTLAFALNKGHVPRYF